MTAADGPTLYDRLGGQQAIDAAVDAFHERVRELIGLVEGYRGDVVTRYPVEPSSRRPAWPG